ncbi:M24 family metallopeptidase [Enterobacter hormaechei]|uniref:M24 family metallopeptidase n=1 Tax=Enterobacter hormaechei TaxID=158836 RepID=UPI0039BF1298
MDIVFSNQEFENRIVRAQEEMQHHKLDALLVTSPPNFRYFTGFDSQFWESPTRPWFFIIPARGKCIAVVPEIGASLIKGSWIDKILSWPAPIPEDDGISLLTSALQSIIRKFGRIGMEFGRESVVRMPINDLFRLKDSLQDLELVDGSPCIWNLRAIKSEAEVECIKTSCTIVCDAFDNLPSYARSGMMESEIVKALTIDIFSGGAHSVPFMAAASGFGGYDQIISRGGKRVLGDGDILIIDVGATINGYFCDFDRNFGFGKISDAALYANSALYDATSTALRVAAPGVSTSELWKCMAKSLEDSGLQANNSGRLGHGLGLQFTEPPSNMVTDNTLLKAGMVITIEPSVEYIKGKSLAHEENILITEDGPVLLTRRAPRELIIIEGNYF